MSSVSVSDVRKDFPFFKRNKVYLDSSATSQKPQCVLDSVDEFYKNHCANVHRGVNSLAEEATLAFEGARKRVADFIGASPREIIFTRNATESINLVALSWGYSNVKRGDIILLTELEHHSNLVPWQMLAERVGAKLEFVPITESGELDWNAFVHLLSHKPKLFAFSHVSNVLGTVNLAKKLIAEAHKFGIPVLVDAAQSVPHLPVDVKDLDCDFLVFSGHKCYAPFGIGVLFGKKDLLEKMPPVFGGGDMIKSVSFEKSSWNDVPWKFEAGTPDVSGAVGLASALDYLNSIGMANVFAHEQDLVKYALDKLNEISGVTIYGPVSRAGVISFNLGDMHGHDVSNVLDEFGVIVRSGHHCAQPLLSRLGVSSTVRVSFGVYNSRDDVDAFIDALNKAKKVFKL